MISHPRVILLIIPNLSPGGAQNVFRQHYEFLTRRYRVYGCVFNWDGTSSLQWPSGITSLDVPAGMNAFDKILRFVERIRKLRQLKNNLKIDLSISHLEGADYVNIISRRSDKVILWIHGSKAYDANISGIIGWLRKSFLMPLLYRRAERIVTVSKGIQQELSKSYPGLDSKVVTIYNGFDLDKILSLQQEPLESEFQPLFGKYFVIVTHCRLARQKNLSAFIQIAFRLREIAEIKWLIIGDGELRNELLLQCNHLGISVYNGFENQELNFDSQVYFIGYKSNPYPFLLKSKLFLMTSSWEGLPLSLCEAMACALPVVATDCPSGPKEILSEDCLTNISSPTYEKFGILLPLLNHPKRIEESAEAIKQLLNNQQILKKYGEWGFERVRIFSTQIMFPQIESLVDSIA
jgi:glycosyltransferase involved in cell wall biosynthesis